MLIKLLVVSTFTLLLPCLTYGQEKKVSDTQNLRSITVKDKTGFIDSNGTVVIPPKYNSTGDFCEGLASALAQIPNTRNPSYGFIDTKGNLVIPYKFKFTGCFSEGLVSAILNASGQKGYFDKTGKLVIAHQYEEAANFSEGLSSVKKGNKYGYINKSGKVVIPFQFSNAFDFKDGLAVVSIGESPNTQFGMIDKSGKFFLNPQFAWLDSFSEGLAKVSVGSLTKSKNGFIDRFGKYAILPKYEGANDFSEGLAAVYFVTKYDSLGNSEEGKWGFIDRSGTLVIDAKFEGAENFSEGLASVKIGNVSGYIDRTGKIVIPAKYETAERFSTGIAKVSDLESELYIDKKGKVVWSPDSKGSHYAELSDEELNQIAEQMVNNDVIPNSCLIESGHPKRIFSSATKHKLSPSGVVGVEVSGQGCACLGARRCGSWLFMKTVDGYRLLADGGATDGFEVLKTMTNGYYDVRTTLPDSFLRGIYFQNFRFNGRKYDEKESGCIPITQSKAEARRSKLPPQCVEQ